MMMLILSLTSAVIAMLIALAVIFKKPNRLSNISFFISILATVCVTLSDTMAVFRPEQLRTWKIAAFISEAIMAPSWLLFSLTFARTSYRETIGRFSRFLLLSSPVFLILLSIAPQEAFYYSPEFERERVLFLGNTGYIFNLLLLLYTIAAIFNLEATLRSSSGINRWQIKFMLIGVVGILGLNIFYYSHALLYRSVDMNILPVRTGGFFISFLLIGFSILRHKLMDVEITVSRGVLYRSLSVIIVGFYLLGLGLIGEGMRYFGPKVGKNITTFLGFTGAIGILVIILSEQLRKKVIVFINKNFYSQKYDYRSQWLQFTHLISSKHSFDDLLSSIAKGFKEAIGVRGASVWLHRKDTGEYYCAKTIDAVTLKIKPDRELTGFLREKGWVFNVNDKRCRAVCSHNIEFIEKNEASLIVPLLEKNNLIGFVILRERLAGNEYNYEDYDLLKTLARQATFAIMNAILAEELAEAREMEAMGKLSSFIMHDLKNAGSMLSLIVQNAEEHIDNPDFQKDAMKSVANTAEKIKELMLRLNNLSGRMSLNFKHGNLGVLVKEVIREFNLNGKKNINFKEIEPVETLFDREEMRNVLINVIMNAIDAITEKGSIEVVVGLKDGMGFIQVTDTGTGMPREFVEKRLFRPFQTTKSKGLGIGLYHCKSIVEAHSGKVKVTSTEGKGSDFFIYLPILTESVHTIHKSTIPDKGQR